MKKPGWLLILAAVLLIISGAFFLRGVALGRSLPSQLEGERWRGGNGMEFCQLTVFLPENEKKDLEEIYSFRSKLTEALHSASIEMDGEYLPCNDAWCAFGSMTAASDRASGEFSVTAVGGGFFDFHPLRLLSGSYFRQDDLMQDRILLDEESAWLLFGGTELTGMRVNICGRDFTVAGVVSREDDRFSEAAYDSGMGIYMSYDAYTQLRGEEKQKAREISCYELVMPQPVKNFAYGVVSEKFPTDEGEIVNNTARFSLGESVRRLKSLSRRSMQMSAVKYPYWENAARAVEDRCTLMYSLSALLALLPFALLVYWIIRWARYLGRRLREDVFPAIGERTAEAIRVRQRKRWEKKHEKN